MAVIPPKSLTPLTIPDPSSLKANELINSCTLDFCQKYKILYLIEKLFCIELRYLYRNYYYLKIMKDLSFLKTINEISPFSEEFRKLLINVLINLDTNDKIFNDIKMLSLIDILKYYAEYIKLLPREPISSLSRRLFSFVQSLQINKSNIPKDRVNLHISYVYNIDIYHIIILSKKILICFGYDYHPVIVSKISESPGTHTHRKTFESILKMLYECHDKHVNWLLTKPKLNPILTISHKNRQAQIIEINSLFIDSVNEEMEEELGEIEEGEEIGEGEINPRKRKIDEEDGEAEEKLDEPIRKKTRLLDS